MDESEDQRFTCRGHYGRCDSLVNRPDELCNRCESELQGRIMEEELR